MFNDYQLTSDIKIIKKFKIELIILYAQMFNIIQYSVFTLAFGHLVFIKN